jgi:hypothetical protein
MKSTPTYCSLGAAESAEEVIPNIVHIALVRSGGVKMGKVRQRREHCDTRRRAGAKLSEGVVGATK